MAPRPNLTTTAAPGKLYAEKATAPMVAETAKKIDLENQKGKALRN